MREIKFRAWINTDGYKEMVYFGQWKIKTSTDYGMMMDFSNAGLLFPGEPFYGGGYSKDYVLMQYTGLKDRNGKEIYEGDILAFMRNKDSDIEQYRYHVEWGECSWKMADAPVPTHLWKVNAENSRVIGNIYENPELLKI